MTSQPEVPGAAAVFLFKEEITDDTLQLHSVYVRLKVLTESGKEYADVELPYGDQTTITDVAGRTIQPDGTIVPFTGKPYTKQIVKNQAMNVQSKIFTLPAVAVGSILEYRYTWRYPDNRIYDPTWYLQGNLYVRKAHYVWKPFNGKGKYNIIMGLDGTQADRIAWASNLPVGAKVETVSIPTLSTYYELSVHDIPPVIEEPFSPPMNSISMRVSFYYTGARTSDEYWHNAGKNWSKQENDFIGPGSGVRAEVQRMSLGAETPDGKLKKIYAAIMTMDNTDFSREKDKKEVKPQKNTDDVLAQKSGSGTNLTLLFIAMARAAGFKARAAIIAPRDKRFFWPALLNFRQLEDYVAIVEMNGQQQFFDPGERYCPYGLLSWPDAAAEGVQQTDSGSSGVITPQIPYTKSQVKRIGDLQMKADGTIAGTVKFTLTGIPALRWRQQFLLTDLEETKRSLKQHFEEELPKGSTLDLISLEGLEQYEDPLIASYRVTGQLGTPTSKRLIIPAQFFETEAAPRFSSTKRVLPVDMEFGSRTSDAVRIALPPSLHWEAQPNPESYVFKQDAQYRTRFDLHDNALTLYRTIDVGEIFYPVDEYPALHDFFAKVASSDSSQVLITLPAASPAQGAEARPAVQGHGGTGE